MFGNNLFAVWQYIWSYNWLRVIIFNIVAGILLQLLSKNYIYSIGFFVVGMIAYGVYRFILISRLDLLGIEQVIPYSKNREPDDLIPIDKRIQELGDSFLFLGVNAKVLWDSEIFQMMRSGNYQSCSFRFLLMDPNGEAVKRKKERETGTEIQAAQHDIEGTVKRLKGVKDQFPQCGLEIKYYDTVPPFWFIQCDDTMYLQLYPKGRLGIKSSLLVLHKTEKDRWGLFETCMAYGNEIWENHSKPVDITSVD